MCCVKSKIGSMVFDTIEDALIFILNNDNMLFADNAFVKICFEEDN